MRFHLGLTVEPLITKAKEIDRTAFKRNFIVAAAIIEERRRETVVPS